MDAYNSNGQTPTTGYEWAGSALWEIDRKRMSHMKVISNGESLSQSHNLPAECVTLKNQDPVLFTHGHAAALFKLDFDLTSRTAERNLRNNDKCENILNPYWLVTDAVFLVKGD